MGSQLRAYFERRKKEREKEGSKRLAETGFLLGAIATATDEDSDETDIVLGGLAGLFVAAVFEVAFPKTAKVVKSML